jgi:hypothetical protein
MSRNEPSCRIGLPPFVEKVRGGRRSHPGFGGGFSDG